MEKITVIILIVQTVIFAATFLAIYFQLRKQTETHKYNSYMRANESFRALLAQFIGNDNFCSILYPDSSCNKDLGALLFCELILENFERIYYMMDKGWIKGSSWNEWESFLIQLLQSPVMRKTSIKAKDNLWPPFRDRLSTLLYETGSDI